MRVKDVMSTKVLTASICMSRSSVREQRWTRGVCTTWSWSMVGAWREWSLPSSWRGERRRVSPESRM